MQALLIYNPNSGSINQVTAEQLQDALHEVGFDPVYKATTCEEDLDLALVDARGLIVVAGGDGTIRAVTTRVIGKDVVLSLLPLGSANNISRSLGLTGKPLDLIARLQQPQRCYFDVGIIRAPWGVDYFLEAMGYGFFADTLATYSPEQGKSVLRGISAAVQTLTHYQTHTCRMRLDGRDISGNYLMVELLNTTAFGPRLKFAPQADSGDGLFEVVCIHEDARDNFLRYLMSLLTERLEELPNVTVLRGRHLELSWTDFPIHVDGEVRPNPTLGPIPNPAVESTISIGIMPQALEFWIPSSKES